VRNNLLPVFQAGGLYGCFHQPKVLGIDVGAHKKMFTVMLDVVFHPALARLEEREISLWLVGGQGAPFAGCVGIREGHDISLAAAFTHKQEELLVGFVVEQLVVGRVLAYMVTEEFVWPQGRVEGDVEKGLVVICPGHAGMVIYVTGCIGDFFGQQAVLGQIFQVQNALLRAFFIDRLGQFAVIGADRECAHPAE